MTVLETLRCPGCSTRFVLRPARVHPGIRRARCFRCNNIFGIEAEVGRLLEPAPAPVPAPRPAMVLEEPPSLTLDDLQGVQDDLLEAPGEAYAEPPLPVSAAPGWEPALTLAPEPALNLAPEPELTLSAEPEPAIEPELALAAAPMPAAPVPPAPEAAPGRATEPPQGSTVPHFTSARDAIEKLMGQTAPPQPAHPRSSGRGTMDMEATLDALESTLSGSAPEAPASPTASTVKLTSDQIQVAVAAARVPAPAEPPALPRPEFPPRAEAPAPPAAAAQNPDLLKIQLEQETCNNVSVEQMSAWIEQGRVQEFHMVARQYSDHWIEASKVPALRPVFDRVRKARGVSLEVPPSPAPEPPPAKRGLFGGLFGRN